jgi:hypothetical protein
MLTEHSAAAAMAAMKSAKNGRCYDGRDLYIVAQRDIA